MSLYGPKHFVTTVEQIYGIKFRLKISRKLFENITAAIEQIYKIIITIKKF